MFNDASTFIPFKKSYFHDTEHDMYGYITYHDEYFSEENIEDLNINTYDINREITLQLDISKCKYTFKEYYDKLTITQRNSVRLYNLFVDDYIERTIKLKTQQNIMDDYVSTYFPGNVHISIGNINYLINLANKTRQPLHFINSEVMRIWYFSIFNELKDSINVINYNKDLLQHENFFKILDLARYSQDCVLAIHVENYNDIKGTKVMDYITNYVVYK